MEKQKWIKKYPTQHITEELLRKVAASFIGEQEQIAPIHSAKKVDGKRAYEYARAGEYITLKANTIRVSKFELLTIEMPHVDFRITCSKGTYIRSIARDFGERVHSGGHLTQLRRTGIGDYQVKDALKIEDIGVLLK